MSRPNIKRNIQLCKDAEKGLSVRKLGVLYNLRSSRTVWEILQKKNYWQQLAEGKKPTTTNR